MARFSFNLSDLDGSNGFLITNSVIAPMQPKLKVQFPSIAFSIPPQARISILFLLLKETTWKPIYQSISLKVLLIMLYL